VQPVEKPAELAGQTSNGNIVIITTNRGSHSVTSGEARCASRAD